LREWPAEGNESKPESRKWERPEDFLDIFFLGELGNTKGSKSNGLKGVENKRRKRDE